LSAKELVKANGHFPHALVPHADTMEDVLSEWREAGLEPVEVSEEDLTTEITVTATRHDGKMAWTVTNADGLRAMALMAVALRSMFLEYTGGTGRSKLQRNTPDTKVLIQVQDGNVQMAASQTQDATALEGILVACLWKMLEQAETNEHPLDKFTGMLTFDLGDE
jgi:hypothetical protein